MTFRPGPSLGDRVKLAIPALSENERFYEIPVRKPRAKDWHRGRNEIPANRFLQLKDR